LENKKGEVDLERETPKRDDAEITDDGIQPGCCY
jgi:hypothetical protein